MLLQARPTGLHSRRGARRAGAAEVAGTAGWGGLIQDPRIAQGKLVTLEDLNACPVADCFSLR